MQKYLISILAVVATGVLSVTFTHPVHAQIRWGIKTGSSVNFTHISPATYNQAYGRLCFTGGIFAEQPIRPSNFLTIELLYTGKGGSHHFDWGTVSNRLFYLELPLTVKSLIHQGWYLNAGVSISSALHGKRYVDDQKTRASFTSIDWGPLAGIGKRLNLPKNYLDFEIRYFHGIQNISRLPDESHYHRSIFLTVGYVFSSHH
jgi:hypothetical protein